MQSDASLSWLALALTPGLASRLSARVLRRFDSPDGVFRATLRDLESCHLPAQVSQAIVKKESFKRAEKELAGIQKIAGSYGCQRPRHRSARNGHRRNGARLLVNFPCVRTPHRRISPCEIASLPACHSAWWWWKARSYSGSLITARLAMEFGREVFGVPGNVTQPVSFAPNQLIKQGAKLATGAGDVIEELPTPIRAALLQAEQRNLLAAAALNGSQKKLYELLSAEEPVHIDDIVERSGLNSSEILATLFDLEMKGVIRKLPGKQFSKVLLWEQIGVCIVRPGPASNRKAHPQGLSPHQNDDSIRIRAGRLR